MKLLNICCEPCNFNSTDRYISISCYTWCVLTMSVLTTYESDTLWTLENTYSGQYTCPSEMQCTLDIFCSHAVCTGWAMCIGAWTESVHCMCTVYLLVHLTLTVRDACKLYNVHHMHCSVHLQHTTCANCSMWGAFSVYCAPSASLRSFIVHSTVHVQLILCTGCTAEWLTLHSALP